MNRLFQFIIWRDYQIGRFAAWLYREVRFLPHRMRLIWHRLWIRRDEFHHSLDMDGRAIRWMNKKQCEKYIQDLIRRREIAHRRDLARLDNE